MSVFPSKVSGNNIGTFLETMGAVRRVRESSQAPIGTDDVETTAKAILVLLSDKALTAQELAEKLAVSPQQVEAALNYLRASGLAANMEDQARVKLTGFAVDALRVFDLR